MPELPDLGSSAVDVAIRTAIVYVFLVVALRIAGRREVGQLSILDLVVVLIIANSVQNAMVGQNATLLGGLVSALTLIVMDRILRTVLGRNRRLVRLLEGEPIMVVRDGEVLAQAMRRAGLAEDELEAALRAHGVSRPAEVELAVLESDGSISVIPRGSNEPPVGVTGLG